MKTYILCNGENFLYGLMRHFLMLNPLCISPPFMEADPITVKLCAPGRGRARRDARPTQQHRVQMMDSILYKRKRLREHHPTYFESVSDLDLDARLMAFMSGKSIVL